MASIVAFILSLTSKLPAPLTATSEPALLTLLSYSMIATALPTVLALTRGGLAAPYGKYASTALAASFGPPMDGRLAWVLQELPSLLIPLLLWRGVALSPATPAALRAELAQPNQRTVLLALFLAHYANRALVFPLRIRGGKPTPVGIMLMALCFCLWNGYLQGRALTLGGAAAPFAGGDDVLEPRFVCGVAIFCLGMAVNLHADAVLRALRRPGETGYSIPVGGAFDYVSGANFAGEIVEWAGFALAANSLPAFAFFVFTAANIGPRALQHHQWYLQKFGDKYPKDRRALVPFLL
jgi:3-oxo-5-alpha-steroid 4-dehydrogenase 1